MKILLLSTHDNKGGASKAAFRLNKALNKNGVTSVLLVRNKTVEDPSVIAVEDIYQGRAAVFEQLPVYNYTLAPFQLFSSATVNNKALLQWINHSDADVVHIHWAAQGFISLEDIAKINKPILFTLHDMWLFTGGCHYSKTCNAYLSLCQACPALGSTAQEDLSTLNFNRKKNLFEQRPDITVVGLSKWIAEEAKKSRLLQDTEIAHLVNPIDIGLYTPIEKEAAREALNLPQDLPIVLFGADGGTHDPRKGYSFLDNILSDVLAIRNLCIVTFGNRTFSSETRKKHRILHLPSIRDESHIALLLNSADVVVLPSIQENLSNLILESLCCGTPVVAFKVGGNADMIDHKENGYLARPADPRDLGTGVQWALDNYHNTATIHNKVAQEYSYEVVATKYRDFYRTLISRFTQPDINALPNNILQPGNRKDFEWTTAELERWIISLEKIKQPCYLYGFGVLGKYLYARLSSKWLAVIDKHYKQHQTYYPNVQFTELGSIPYSADAVVVISLYDPQYQIQSTLKKYFKNPHNIIGLLESINTDKIY